MDNKQQLLKEAGRYKKWFEHYSVSPCSYVINGRHYYLVDYHGKDPQNFKGYAVISLDGGPKEEYREALYPLTYFAAASANIFNIMQPRTAILPEYYEDVIEVITETNVTADDTLEKGRALFEQLLALQRTFNNLYKEYEQFYDHGILVKQVFTDEDIDYTLAVLSKLDLIQFQQGLLLAEHDDILPRLFHQLNSHNMKKRLSRDSLNFINGIKDNKHILSDRLEQFEFERSIMHLPEEEQIERKKEDTKQSADQLIADRKTRLRGQAAL